MNRLTDRFFCFFLHYNQLISFFLFLHYYQLFLNSIAAACRNRNTNFAEKLYPFESHSPTSFLGPLTCLSVTIFELTHFTKYKSDPHNLYSVSCRRFNSSVMQTKGKSRRLSVYAICMQFWHTRVLYKWVGRFNKRGLIPNNTVTDTCGLATPFFTEIRYRVFMSCVCTLQGWL